MKNCELLLYSVMNSKNTPYIQKLLDTKDVTKYNMNGRSSTHRSFFLDKPIQKNHNCPCCKQGPSIIKENLRLPFQTLRSWMRPINHTYQIFSVSLMTFMKFLTRIVDSSVSFHTYYEDSGSSANELKCEFSVSEFDEIYMMLTNHVSTK